MKRKTYQKKKYMDKYGGVWIKRRGYVMRLSDGNIGHWDEGIGLKLLVVS